MLDGVMSPALPLPARSAVVLACVALLAAPARAGAAPPIDGGSDAFSWNYEAGPEPGLAFGEPGTDNVWASFACNAGSGRVELRLISHDEPQHAYGAHWRARIRLASGASRRAYPARGRGEDLGEQVTAVIPTGDPVLGAFARSGRLSVEGARQDAETPAERRAIRAFLAACG